MDRKGILGLVLTLALFGGWNFYYIRKSQEAALARQQVEAAVAAVEAAKPAPAAPATLPSGAAPLPGTPGAPAAPVSPVLEAPVPEKLERLSTPAADYAFTTLGGGIQRITLLKHFTEKESNVVLNQFGTLPIGAISETPGEGVAKPFAATVDPSTRAITFARTDERNVQLTKKFTLPAFEHLSGQDQLREEYLMKLDVSFTNRSDKPVDVPGYYLYTGSTAPVHQLDQPIYTGYNFFHNGSIKLIDVNWFKGGGMLFFKKGPRPVYPEKPEATSDIRWAGVTNQYFTTLVTPLADEKAMLDEQIKQRGVATWARNFMVNDEAWRAAGHAVTDSGERDGVDGAIGLAGFKLQPGETITRKFSIYAGPREYRRLRELANFEAEVMDFGIFGFVSKFLLNSMNFLNGILGNYAFAIIVLTIFIKLLMWPLQNKATASMKKMQALAPKQAELREKYANDPQAMNVETMKLYKQYGVNPFGGCLPMLVQIPIFFGFYNMLGKAVELRNAKFLWVKDLSLPDTIFHVASFPVNVLPLCMAVTMFWSMTLQPKSGDAMQQRVFMFVPLIFIFFCYNFASALALYWTVQNLFSIVQLYATRTQTLPTLEKLPAPKAKR